MPFRVPVERHCSLKCRWERLAIAAVTKKATGMVTMLTAARSGEIQNIMPITPTMVRPEVISWLRPCWIVVEMLSMSLVTRLKTSPWGCESK